MNVMLDSSFFFPFIQVDVTNLSRPDLLTLFQRQDLHFLRSEITIFEISAKGWKYCHEGLIDEEDLLDGLTYITEMENIEVIPIHYSEIQSLAGTFRRYHADFIDCLVLSSAINHADAFVSLDESLQDKYESTFKPLLAPDFTDFKFLTWTNFTRQVHEFL
jgi:PIN domain nuclease of toxin-antitoxin system